MSRAYDQGFADGLKWDLSGWKSRLEIASPVPADGTFSEALVNAIGIAKANEIVGDSCTNAEESERVWAEYERGCVEGALQQWDNLHGEP